MKTNNPLPKYQIIYEELKEAVSEGKLSPGEKFPSEKQLMDQYGFSRQTVRKALEELSKEGYVQKVRGSGSFVRKPLATISTKSNTVMFIALFAQHYYFSQYIGGVEKVLKENGYVLNIGISNNRIEDEAKCLEDAIASGYAGILFLPAQSYRIHSNLYIYKKIMKAGIPCITMGSHLPQAGIPCVAVDDFEGGRMATDYLIRRGHRDIACIMNRAESCGCLRYSGYLSALDSAGIEPKEDRILWYEYEEFDRFMADEEKLLACLSQVTAVFCFNDEMALGVINFLREHDIQVPGDVSVIGFDDSYLCRISDIKITSVRQDPFEMGEKAAGNLLQLMKNPHFSASYFYEPTIEERETVRDL
ncbi:GntR family transcriptional regulator [Diplocloster agilis]|uniref:GntR family transcriptional regulator n=1 Tax=Diplocloster agilis TaxID=2850323 RepID=UPI000820ACDA|nr:GntR family transcriptional regulator [Suonthocola fibrivorans]MCU6735855.1 GntR family transcriptional regulator [Suonthocola fibrivorans]SCJ83205.1 Arabinose metabolism transcriptional repressor [uncultured Clostridium sp.]